MRLVKYLKEQDGVPSKPSDQTSGAWANYGMGAVTYKQRDNINRKKKKQKNPKEVKKPFTTQAIADTSGESMDGFHQY